MGGCCARQQDINFDAKNSIQYSFEEPSRIMKNISKPELKFEENKLEINDEEIELAFIIKTLQSKYKDKVKIITEIELFNLAIYYKENYINSDYLIYDMRSSCEQTEDYLKKIRHINYTFDQIKNIQKIKKESKLKEFINSKKIIVIIPEQYLNKETRGRYPLDLCQRLYNINDSICFKILNKCINKSEDRNYKLEEYLSVFHSYDFIPFILFTYKHVTTLYKEGYFFISFLDKQIFSFEDYINNINNVYTSNGSDNFNCNTNNELNLKYKFFDDLNITTIFNVDNNLENSFDIKEYQYQKSQLKEIYLNKNDLKNRVNQIVSILEWVKQEVRKGHSCYFNIKNFPSNSSNDNNWIFAIIIIISLVVEVDYNSVIDYLKEKMIYINNIVEILENSINDDEISDTLSKY